MRLKARARVKVWRITLTEEEQRKIIEEFLDFFLGEKKENEKDWPLLSLIGISREKVIDDFFNSRK